VIVRIKFWTNILMKLRNVVMNQEIKDKIKGGGGGLSVGIPPSESSHTPGK
jgi:hypothetical protein